MSASERAGEQPRPAAHLQPDHCEKAGADAARSALLEAEHDHVEQLRKTGFAGPAYEAFKQGLAAYGLPIIQSWIRTREIFKFSREFGRGVACANDVREHLATHMDDRLELAMETVAQGLVSFRRDALAGGRWTPEGGASLKTFFVGSCLLAFPNAFRCWLKEHEIGVHLRRVTVQTEDLATELDRLILNPGDDPADIVVDRQWLLDELASMPARVRNIVAAVVLRDEDYKTIATRLDTTPDGIKQTLYRYRTDARRRLQGRRQP